MSTYALSGDLQFSADFQSDPGPQKIKDHGQSEERKRLRVNIKKSTRTGRDSEVGTDRKPSEGSEGGEV